MLNAWVGAYSMMIRKATKTSSAYNYVNSMLSEQQ